jgi:hypothetical protein
VLLLGLLQAAAASSPKPRENDESQTPSVDFLLFLADFDDSDGEVLDRAELATAQERQQPADTVHDDED